MRLSFNRGMLLTKPVFLNPKSIQPVMNPNQLQSAVNQDIDAEAPPTSIKQNATSLPAIPEYLSSTYTWAYLNPKSVARLDQGLVVSTILWGNANRLMRAAVNEFSAGQHVLQSACVYGSITPDLAKKIGPDGQLMVVDVAPVQIANMKRKLPNTPQLNTLIADLSVPGCLSHLPDYDGVCCFFLLHEVPVKERSQIVENLLQKVKPAGKVVFVDYHKPAWWHPLNPITYTVFHFLEPFAKSLLSQPIQDISSLGKEYTWQKKTLFGGLYQILVGIRNKT